MKRIGEGEYEHEGYSISKDEYDGTWWVWGKEDNVREDFIRLKDAKNWINDHITNT